MSAGGYPTAYRSGAAGHARQAGFQKPAGPPRPANDNRPSGDVYKFAAKGAIKAAGFLARRLNPWLNAGLTLWEIYEFMNRPGGAFDHSGYTKIVDCFGVPEERLFGSAAAVCGPIAGLKTVEGQVTVDAFPGQDRHHYKVIGNVWNEDASAVYGDTSGSWEKWVPTGDPVVSPITPDLAGVVPNPFGEPAYYPAADPKLVPPGLPTPQPKPLPLPLLKSRTMDGWAEQSEWGYGPKERPRLALAFAPRRKPGPKVKEKKLVAQVTLLRLLTKIFNGLTETKDVVDALWKAIHAHDDKARKKLKINSHKLLWTRTKDVYRHLDKVDWDQAVQNLVENYLEDKAYGKAFKAAQKFKDNARRLSTGTRSGVSKDMSILNPVQIPKNFGKL